MATITPQRKSRAAEAVLDLVRRRPGITVREIADELGRIEDINVILHAMRDMELVVSRPAHDREPAAIDALADAWGPPPSEAELADAQRVGEVARESALAGALTGALTRDRAAARLGVTPQAVSERMKAAKLVGLRRGREWRFPAWQFGDDAILPGLDEVIDAWPGTPLALSVWAVTPSVDLDGRTPAQALVRRGGPERVLELARALGAAAW